MAFPPDNPKREASLAGSADVAGWMARYGPALRRHFHKRGAGQDTDDLIQDVFVRLQQGAASAEIENVERYLFRTANNVLANHFRHDRVRERAFEDRYEGVEWPDELSPERVMMGRQTLAQLIAGLRTLPPRAREAFVFHRFEEMTYPAIAKEMGISVSGVEKLIIRALEHLGAAVETKW